MISGEELVPLVARFYPRAFNTIIVEGRLIVPKNSGEYDKHLLIRHNRAWAVFSANSWDEVKTKLIGYVDRQRKNR
ncbi:MAG: hypothetical protein UX91_C0015G0005 [Candidatus Amesbacteria bacterium GW2011_GWB1_47_19]|nr:MAG: hypothetical protein UX91_C0015G0005 [Candidatus Amesbacteria bacterium GW2011_GWB1_47_19]